VDPGDVGRCDPSYNVDVNKLVLYLLIQAISTVADILAKVAEQQVEIIEQLS
jgi:hypothetical protein